MGSRDRVMGISHESAVAHSLNFFISNFYLLQFLDHAICEMHTQLCSTTKDHYKIKPFKKGESRSEWGAASGEWE